MLTSKRQISLMGTALDSVTSHYSTRYREVVHRPKQRRNYNYFSHNNNIPFKVFRTLTAFFESCFVVNKKMRIFSIFLLWANLCISVQATGVCLMLYQMAGKSCALEHKLAAWIYRAV